MYNLLTDEISINGIKRYKGLQLKTGQTTVYAARDDGDILAGIAKLYQVLSAGAQYSLTTPVYLPCFAQNDLVFTIIGRTITSVTGGLAVVKTGDVIRIRGSTSNDGEYLVSGGNNANTITLDATTPPLAGETSAVYITIAKQALQSNNCVQDLETGLMWLRYGSYSPAKLGAASDGNLLWTATAVTIHAASNDLQMIAGGKGLCTVKIIAGAGEVLKYWPGYGYSFTAFANAVNKLPGFSCVSVTVNGADLDIVLNTGNRTCIAEAAGVNGAINLACNGLFPLAKACNQAAVGGYSDWRVPNVNEFFGLGKSEGAVPLVDADAFPSAPAAYIFTATTYSIGTTRALMFDFQGNYAQQNLKTTSYFAMLVRGGI